MNKLDSIVFDGLFREAFQQCFGHALTHALTETEARQFCNVIFEATGLVIGQKSVKNYSQFIVNPSTGKPENPSPTTRDTFARYVLHAPYTSETGRKDKEGHLPYWFQYRMEYIQAHRPAQRWKFRIGWIIFALLAGLVLITGLIFRLRSSIGENYVESFKNLQDDTLQAKGWRVSGKQTDYWDRRAENPGYLTLFTLRGDNWPDSSVRPIIPDMLMRRIRTDCFVAEIHFSGFIPVGRWQQAGLLLMEEPGFSGRCLRLSIAYNDYYGGFAGKPEVLVQLMESFGKGNVRPEEIVHMTLFHLDSLRSNLIMKQNMENSALRIEKQGKEFRFLLSFGKMKNPAFKEIISREMNITPRFIGIFALKGNVSDPAVNPVRIDYFRLTETGNCK